MLQERFSSHHQFIPREIFSLVHNHASNIVYPREVFHQLIPWKILFTGSFPMRGSQASWRPRTPRPTAAPPPCSRPSRPGCPETIQYWPKKQEASETVESDIIQNKTWNIGYFLNWSMKASLFLSLS